MSNATYRVFVVLDGEYGTRVSQLLMSGPVWIVDTPTNRDAAEAFWKAFPNRGHLDGVTVFAPKNPESAEATLLSELDTIDEHHNAFSAEEPYSELEVIGASLSEKIQTELSAYGFAEFFATTEGFRAARALEDSSCR